MNEEKPPGHNHPHPYRIIISCMEGEVGRSQPWDRQDEPWTVVVRGGPFVDRIVEFAALDVGLQAAKDPVVIVDRIEDHGMESPVGAVSQSPPLGIGRFGVNGRRDEERDRHGCKDGRG